MREIVELCACMCLFFFSVLLFESKSVTSNTASVQSLDGLVRTERDATHIKAEAVLSRAYSVYA